MQAQNSLSSYIRRSNQSQHCIIIPIQETVPDLLDLCDSCGIPHSKMIYTLRKDNHRNVLLVVFSCTRQELQKTQLQAEIYNSIAQKNKWKKLSVYSTPTQNQIQKYEGLEPIYDPQALNRFYKKLNTNLEYQVQSLLNYPYKLWITTSQFQFPNKLDSIIHWKQLIYQKKGKQWVWLVGTCLSFNIFFSKLCPSTKDKINNIQSVTDSLMFTSTPQKQLIQLQKYLAEKLQLKARLVKGIKSPSRMFLEFDDNQYSIKAYQQIITKWEQKVKFGYHEESNKFGYFCCKSSENLTDFQQIISRDASMSIIAEISGQNGFIYNKCVFYEDPELVKHRNKQILQKRLQIATEIITVNLFQKDVSIITDILQQLQLDQQQIEIKDLPQKKSEQISKKISFISSSDAMNFFQKGICKKQIQRIIFSQ